MALTRQRQGYVATSVGPHSSTAPSRRGAALSCVVAAPIFFGCRPAGHPVGKSSVAIIGRRSGAHRRTSTSSLIGAAFTMDSAAPLFLTHRPACLPIEESISAIVWVCWCDWQHWHRSHWHWNWHRHGAWWWRSGRAPTMVDPAAPGFLVRLPCALRIHCAIEGINRS